MRVTDVDTNNQPAVETRASLEEIMQDHPNLNISANL
jgi:hypothetical protein